MASTATGIEADTVLFDNGGGARQAIDHLLRQGHRRIAFVGDPPRLYTASERLEGYRAALRGAGVEPRDELVSAGSHDAGSAERAVRELLALPAERRPTALFTANNRNTIGALRALREHNKSARIFDSGLAISLFRDNSTRTRFSFSSLTPWIIVPEAVRIEIMSRKVKPSGTPRRRTASARSRSTHRPSRSLDRDCTSAGSSTRSTNCGSTWSWRRLCTSRRLRGSRDCFPSESNDGLASYDVTFPVVT